MNTKLKSIDPRQFTYSLPENRIAKYPLDKRSESNLLVYQQGKIDHKKFFSIVDELPANSQLIFNDTKVIPARINFQKDTGAHIEVFLLEPLKPTPDIAQAMTIKGESSWRCMVGNFKKWKDGQYLTLNLNIENDNFDLQASIEDREDQIIKFQWAGDYPFVEIVQAAGKIPLPPYIKREVSTEDLERYQTVYSKNDGAVAAPTAGLHFTDEIISQLKTKGIDIDYVTLHVSAGTFQPIKVDDAIQHVMHSEQILVSRANIDSLLQDKPIISVGTTSMRTMESLYWYGVKLLNTKENKFQIEKLEAYKYKKSELPDKKESLEAVKKFMIEHQLETIQGQTEIYIFPGYTFRVCDGLITNFHLPGSTLILLVAAFIGEDWRKVYKEALNNNYRFLSYGDSSLLLK